MDKQKLKAVARGIVAPGKGVLAADESFPTIEPPSTVSTRTDIAAEALSSADESVAAAALSAVGENRCTIRMSGSGESLIAMSVVAARTPAQSI